ncbi:MAG: nucleotide sugar dehydrogenase [Calditrichaeota bacterium]|nr:nucleotide sugar dehydrogenase [Calditrichota bacterium]MCB9368643.1 nucleotide sugar dehydrogenase [Calditrichota bacterium]
MILNELKKKAQEGTLRVGVVGLGYVGLPLAVQFAVKGISVTGIDITQGKVDLINRGENYILDVNDKELADSVKSGKLKATTDYSVIKDLDAISICVPTPLRKTGDPDISYIIAARDEILKYAHPGLLIVLESTTYPGTTDELMVPAFEEKGLKVGEDVFIAFSPERVDPGNEKYGTFNTPKVMGGSTPACLDAAQAVYGLVIEKLVPVSSTQAAELVKLLENTFRSINIGLVNELAIMCEILGVDVWEVIRAASTKPFGFMPFYPGPGLGGHCIPIDPIYLSWKLKTLKYRARFIELADDINTKMPDYVTQRVADALNERGKAVKGCKALVMGVAYKRDIDDSRESPSLDIIELLMKRGAQVDYHDPFIPEVDTANHRMKSVPFNKEAAKKYDVAVICTDHRSIDYAMLAENCALVFDARNATAGLGKRDNVVKL